MQKSKLKTFIETGRVIFVPLTLIRPNPGQPRKVFDKEALQELAGSIAQYGVLQPVSVRRRGSFYELVAGERRLRAARLAGLEEIPCIVMTMDEEQSGMLALVENLQRADLDYIEEAQGIARLMRLYGLSQEQAARRLGKSQSAVANKLRLLRHSPAVLERLREAHLSERHARALLRLETEDERLLALEQIIQRDLTVAKTEDYIDSLLQKKAQSPAVESKEALSGFLTALERQLKLVRQAGRTASLDRRESEHEIVLTIRLTK